MVRRALSQDEVRAEWRRALEEVAASIVEREATVTAEVAHTDLDQADADWMDSALVVLGRALREVRARVRTLADSPASDLIGAEVDDFLRDLGAAERSYRVVRARWRDRAPSRSHAPGKPFTTASVVRSKRSFTITFGED